MQARSSSPASASPTPASPAQLAVIDQAIARHEGMRGATLEIFHAIQRELGYVPHEATARIATALNWTRADVHGVLTYYHDFRTAPPGRHILKVCRAEACQAMGQDALEAHLDDAYKVAVGETSEDGELTVEPAYCLGNCALAPSVLLDDRVHGCVGPERLDALLARAKADDASASAANGGQA